MWSVNPIMGTLDSGKNSGPLLSWQPFPLGSTRPANSFRFHRHKWRPRWFTALELGDFTPSCLSQAGFDHRHALAAQPGPIGDLGEVARPAQSFLSPQEVDRPMSCRRLAGRERFAESSIARAWRSRP